MTEDHFARASAMAANSILTRLLSHLTERGLASKEDVASIVTEAEMDLRAKATEFASGAIGVLQNIFDTYRAAVSDPSPPSMPKT